MKKKVITRDFQVPKTELAHAKRGYGNKEQIFLPVLAQKTVSVLRNTASK